MGHELTTDDGGKTERVATQTLATERTLKVKNEEAKANSTLVTKLKTQKKPPNNQLQSPTTTLKTKTQPNKSKPTLKTPNHKNQRKFSSLSTSTWPALAFHHLTISQKLPEKLTTARTFCKARSSKAKRSTRTKPENSEVKNESPTSLSLIAKIWDSRAVPTDEAVPTFTMMVITTTDEITEAVTDKVETEEATTEANSRRDSTWSPSTTTRHSPLLAERSNLHNDIVLFTSRLDYRRFFKNLLLGAF